jgi:predicted ATPase
MLTAPSTILAQQLAHMPLSLLHERPGAAASAEIHFRQALDGARDHGALSWELRAATSLARLLRNQGRPSDATACLQPIYDRFTEGFSTADLIAAKQLLDERVASRPSRGGRGLRDRRRGASQRRPRGVRRML